MIDAVLYTQIGMAKEHGIAVDCQVQNFSCDTVSQEKLARLLFELLDFGIRENEQPRSGNERYMHIQIQNIVHQTAIAFKTVAGVQRRKSDDGFGEQKRNLVQRLRRNKPRMDFKL